MDHQLINLGRRKLEGISKWNIEEEKELYLVVEYRGREEIVITSGI